MEISEKEFAVIREISNNHLPDQRTIAIRTGISLGLTNLIIKRLITKGYVKAKQLDRKKIQYILTPKGFSEKANKSYNFTLRTIGLFKAIREKIQERILSECAKGSFHIELSGNNELAAITELAIKNISDQHIKFYRTSGLPHDHESVILTINNSSGKHTIDMLSFLVESGLFYQ